MLYIIMGKENDGIWRVGMPPPLQPIEIDSVTEIQADSDELRYVLEEFASIPRTVRFRRVMSWYGDHAKFIVRHLGSC